MSTPVDTRLRHPFTCLVSGPTCCGKTEFVKKLVQSRDWCIDQPVQDIIWCYGEWQPAYEELKHQVRFTNEIISPEDLDPRVVHLVILDDQMDNDKDKDKVERLFIKSCHHRNTSVIYIVQNLFSRGKNHRTCSLNTHYFLIFKNPRDSQQVETLSRQMFPTRKRYLTESYIDATRVPFGYLLIDAKPNTPEHLRLRSDILNRTAQIAYVPEDYKFEPLGPY